MIQYITEEIKNKNMNKFNLVYNRWDQITGERIPNGGTEIGMVERCWDGSGLLRHFISNGNNCLSDMFELEFFKLEDVYSNRDKKFYYIIDHGRIDLKESFDINKIFDTEKDPPFDKVYEKTSLLNEDVIKCFKECDNLRIMYITEHEPDDEIGFITLVDYLRKKGIENDRIYVMNNNSNLELLKAKYNTNINVRTLKFIPFSCILAFDVIKSEYNPNKAGKFFMCHNKGPKIHRILLLSLFRKMNLLDNINWSYIPPYRVHTGIRNFIEHFNISDLYPILDDLEYIIKLNIKVGDYEKNRNWFNEAYKEFSVQLPMHVLIPEDRETLENSYVNIVTESSYLNSNINVVHITEKSIRPFYFHQIPIILATPNHVKTLREKFNLDMFDDIVDHSYDNEFDDKKRIFILANEIERLDENKESIIEFYKNNKQRFEDNKNKILKILSDREDYHYFKNLI